MGSQSAIFENGPQEARVNGKTSCFRTRFELLTSSLRGTRSNHFTSNPPDGEAKIWQFKVNYKPKPQIEAILREKFKYYFSRRIGG